METSFLRHCVLLMLGCSGEILPMNDSDLGLGFRVGARMARYSTAAVYLILTMRLTKFFTLAFMKYTVSKRNGALAENLG